jgi:hypothetical protein
MFSMKDNWAWNSWLEEWINLDWFFRIAIVGEEYKGNPMYKVVGYLKDDMEYNFIHDDSKEACEIFLANLLQERKI